LNETTLVAISLLLDKRKYMEAETARNITDICFIIFLFLMMMNKAAHLRNTFEM